jgi:N-methylhydantoinase A
MRVGVDTGGTFTDVVAVGADGELRVRKVPSTPQAPAEALMAALADLSITDLVHSTTVATNALLERSGGPTALVTTAGFEDVLELGRQARPKLYALHPVKIPPLIPAELRLGLDERLAADGSVLRAPSAAALRELCERVRALDVRSVAVCLLHAYANPAHERLVAEALAPLGLALSLSSEVLPVPREYERTSTTVADAYVQPVMAPYLRQIAAPKMRVLQSNGGALSLDEAIARPVRTVLSGPAAGVVGALAVARTLGVRDLLTLDMGGTSTDVALVVDGECALTDEAEVAGLVVQLPMLAIHTVGAGGGSIARLDEAGALKVGPQSAGADPGPAAYGRGGRLPTVTDADLILGRLSAAHFLGGAAKLEIAAARAALATLGGDLVEAAEGVAAVADLIMARALKTVSVERGVDARGFALLPFGGAGAMHACGVARELGLTKILVPPSPGLLCAYGALVANLLHERVATLLQRLPIELASTRAALEREVAAALAAGGVPESERRLTCTAHLRYQGQSFDLPVDAGENDLAAAFHEAHRTRYGYALPDRAVELVTLRVRGFGATPPLAPPREPPEAGDVEIGRLTSRWDGRDHQTPILARARLRDGMKLDGPALIVEYSATTYLPPGAHAEADAGCLRITL